PCSSVTRGASCFAMSGFSAFGSAFTGCGTGAPVGLVGCARAVPIMATSAVAASVRAVTSGSPERVRSGADLTRDGTGLLVANGRKAGSILSAARAVEGSVQVLPHPVGDAADPRQDHVSQRAPVRTVAA